MGLVANQNVQKCMAFKSSGFLVINRFEYDYAFLSNFYPCEVLYKGIVFPSSEHAFQAAKAKHYEEMLWVAEAPSAKQAKYRGRQVTLKPDWEQLKIGEMYTIVYSKFSDPELKTNLLSTVDHRLVEGNYWHDQFWGDCSCTQHTSSPGSNYLGKILMLIRADMSYN